MTQFNNERKFSTIAGICVSVYFLNKLYVVLRSMLYFGHVSASIWSYVTLAEVAALAALLILGKNHFGFMIVFGIYIIQDVFFKEFLFLPIDLILFALFLISAYLLNKKTAMVVKILAWFPAGLYITIIIYDLVDGIIKGSLRYSSSFLHVFLPSFIGSSAYAAALVFIAIWLISSLEALPGSAGYDSDARGYQQGYGQNYSQNYGQNYGQSYGQPQHDPFAPNYGPQGYHQQPQNQYQNTPNNYQGYQQPVPHQQQGWQTRPAPQNQPASANVAEQLRTYKELCDAGVITQADYEAKKRQIMGI